MKPNFLIVDDDTSCTDLLTTMLSALGCDSVAVHSGAEALTILSDKDRAVAFDAVFLDIMMPGIDGLTVLRTFRELPHGDEVPVLLLTALDKSEHVLNGYLTGATYYITKPFSQEQVVYGLDMLLGGDESDGDAKVFQLDE